MAPQVVVALATFNGERFLDDQIASIVAQSEKPTRIAISDDGSTDATQQIIERWKQSHPGLIDAMPWDGNRRGPQQNFNRLLHRIFADGAEFCLLSDQDDVWLPDKIASLRGASSATTLPELVVSDLSLVDEHLQLIAPSYWQFKYFPMPMCASIASLSVMSVFPGCSMMLNRSLMRCCLPIPAEAIMHDHWIAQVAAAMGGIQVVPRPLVLYRQHGQNTVGVGGSGCRSLVLRLLHFPPSDRQQICDQATRAEQRVSELGGTCEPLRIVSSCRDRPWLYRKLTLLKHGIHKRPWWRNLWFFFRW